MVAFTDLDDILIPVQPMRVYSSVNIDLLEDLAREHPQAGSFLFEHRDVRLILPEDQQATPINNFNFDFLIHSDWKKGCSLRRMKTRVVVNASRVDSVNMHETGIHRLGHTQVRVPCHRAHFYHMRHSFREPEVAQSLNMFNLLRLINSNFQERLKTTLNAISELSLNNSITETLNDFDRCVKEVNKEHFTLKVSRCMTPHACNLKLSSDVACTASTGNYEFVYASGDFLLGLMGAQFVKSNANCDAPISAILKGDHFYAP
ncbi:unnamed protein product [Gongylonema pulchrum]|uniref:Glycosyltransferase family 92 protein n=1 Tax=Gongylonema pulchrum TaxID=637853 RepID=A0A183CXG3_9BILA|nr:unnamed protein product [Gongylonema pulchrum]